MSPKLPAREEIEAADQQTAAARASWLAAGTPESLLHRASLLRRRARRASVAAVEAGLLRAALACEARAKTLAAGMLGDEAETSSAAVDDKHSQAEALLLLAWRAEDSAGVEAVRAAAYALMKDAEQETGLVVARALRLQQERRRRRAQRDQKRRLGLD